MVTTVKLNDSNSIPQLGFGTYQVEPVEAVEVVQNALDAGYRHIDTAQMYGNEKQVGEAIKASGLERSDVYITSKLDNGSHSPEDAKKAFTETLEKLDTDYVDLFLIHWPLPDLYGGDFVQTWKTLESFKSDGRAKSIGVSNFQIPHLQQLAQASDTVPAVNQIELHPYFQNREVVEYCEQQGIAIEAWSPIAQGRVLTDETIMSLAQEHDKTPAQIVLRWHLRKGYIVFPKSTTPDRIRENIDLFDFELSDDEMIRIDQLERGERIGPDPDTFNLIA